MFFENILDYIQLLSLVAMCFAGYGNRYEKLSQNRKDDHVINIIIDYHCLYLN